MAEYGVSTTNLFDLLGDGDGAPAPKRDNKKKEQAKAKNDKRSAKPSRATGGGNTRPNKRQFDRRSGTGRGKESSKNGHGRGNWGGAMEFSGEQAPGSNNQRRQGAGRRNQRRGERKDANKDVAEKPTEEAAAEGDAPAVDAEEAKEKEPEVFSYDDYLEKAKENAVEGDIREARVAENDDKQWKSAAQAEQGVPDDVEQKYLNCVEEKTLRRKGKKGKKKAVKMNIDEFAAAQPASNSNKSQRGGRGERGRGRGPRGGTSKPQNLNDHSAFPALGGK